MAQQEDIKIPYIPGVPNELIDLANKELDQEFEDAYQAIIATLAEDPDALTESPDDVPDDQ